MTTAANPRKKSSRHREVLPVSEARREFSSILKGFSDEDQQGPVYIGAHRKAEAVLIPVSLWEHMLDLVDDFAISKIIEERGDGPFTKTSLVELANEIGLEYSPHK
jgi:PHD/YefM family antitoxin component YafN of YafNO toxin-antitoxin module